MEENRVQGGRRCGIEDSDRPSKGDKKVKYRGKDARKVGGFTRPRRKR